MAIEMMKNKDEILEKIASDKSIYDCDYNRVLKQILHPKESIEALGLLILARVFKIEVKLFRYIIQSRHISEQSEMISK